MKNRVLRKKIIATTLVINLLSSVVVTLQIDAAEQTSNTHSITDVGESTSPVETINTDATEQTSDIQNTTDVQESASTEETVQPDTAEQTSDTQQEQVNENTQEAQEKEEEQPTPSQEAEDSHSTNEKLIASQHIVIPPKLELSFRFVKVKKVFAISLDDVDVYEEKNEKSQVVGKLRKDGLCYILEDSDKDKDKNWIYIESGVVRGFVKGELLLMGGEAIAFVEENEEDTLHLASASVEPLLNKSLTYTLTTTSKTVAKKEYAVSNADAVQIREGKDEEARIIGTLSEGALCYILADADEEWIFVESEDVRGFVQKKSLIRGEEVDTLVEKVGEENFTLAEEQITPEENAVCYYTFTSIKEESYASATRRSMITFATQFIGNPYVWGGTSLTNGADCSGFVQSIYAQYGYSLPRIAETQALYGTQIPVGEAEIGDLIFYAENGVVYHVVMYAGDGQVIHASTQATGIKTSGIDAVHAVWATRIITAPSIEDNTKENIRNIRLKERHSFLDKRAIY